MLAFSANVVASCPESSTTMADVESVVIEDSGSTTTLFIGIDPSAGATVDVCGCQDGGSLFLIQEATTVPDSMKMFLALAMEAKALNKKIAYHGISCWNGSGSGYVLFSQLHLEP
jgi:hypothetical protein